MLILLLVTKSPNSYNCFVHESLLTDSLILAKKAVS